MNRTKKVYDKNKGIYVYIDRQTGSGITDTLKNIGKKIFSSAVDSGSKKLGDLAADKIISKISDRGSHKNKNEKPRGQIIMKELDKINIKKNNNTKNDDYKTRINKLLYNEDDYKTRINQLLSGGSSSKNK